MNKTKKAAYIKPTIEVVSVDADVSLLAGSDGDGENTGTAPGHGGEYGSTGPDYTMGELEYMEYEDEEEYE